MGHPSGVFGGSPYLTLTHDPVLPAPSQRSQGRSHGELQQTPSAQKPLAQSAGEMHA